MVSIFSKGRKSDVSIQGTNDDTPQQPHTQYSLSRIIILAAFVMIGGMLIIHYTTVNIVITHNANNATAVTGILDRLDRSNQTLFNILLPVFGAWVGVVVAFYFGSEQAKRAQEAQEKLVKALSPGEEKLSTIKVEDLLNKYPNTKKIQKVTLEDKIKDVITSFGDLSDVLVVKDDKPLGILYKIDLFSKTELAKQDIALSYEKPLKEIIAQITDEFITKKKWDIDKGITNLAEVKPDDNLLHARQKMYHISTQVNDVRCVVTDTGGKAIGIFSYDSIAAFMK
jgi:hypothetical protein